MDISIKGISEEKNGTCYVCHSNRSIGPNIMGKLICRDCLSEISTTNIGEVKYNVYREKIKSIIKNRFEVKDE